MKTPLRRRLKYTCLSPLITAAIISLNACVSLPSDPTDLPAPSDAIPDQHRIAEVPFFAQTQNQCGPATLATVLSYRGQQASPTGLAKTVFVPKRGGSLQIELVAQARQADQLAYTLQPKLADLLTEIANNNPVIVLQNLRFDWWPKWHYAVVKGYNLNKKTLILNSGEREDYQVPWQLFDKTWARAKRWGLVILPPDQLPASGQPLATVQAINDLEQVGKIEAAEQGYRAALTRWSNNQTALFGMANFYHVQGDYSQANRLYQQLLTQNPAFGSGWNNYAYLLLAGRCGQQATQAATCAVNLEPKNGNFKATLKEISLDANQLVLDAELPFKETNRSINCPKLSCPK